MDRSELLSSISEEIGQTEKSLIFWNSQRKLQQGSKLSPIVEEHVSTLNATLAELHKAKDVIRDA